MQTDHHDDGGRRNGEFKRADFRTQHFGETVIHDLDHLLARRHRLEDRLADSLLGDFLYEILDDRQRDIGFEQGDPHFAHRAAHIFFPKGTAPAQLVKNSAKAVAQLIKHVPAFPSSKQPKSGPTQKAPVGETSLTDV